MKTLLELQNHRHKYSEAPYDYYEITQMKVYPDGTSKFIDFNKLEQSIYEIKNTERINALKEHYKNYIEEMLKEAKKDNQTQVMTFT